jgi:hypothetical protein
LPYKDPIKAKAASKESAARWSKRHPEKAAENARLWRARNPKYMLLHSAKRRSKRDGIELSITQDNIPDIPEMCPIADIPLFVRNDGTQGPCENSPTLDRVNPKLGYLPNNIRVISHKGNRWKSDMTIENLERILQYMRGEL